MKSGLIFFICSCSVLALTIVNLSIGPNINKRNDDWNSVNCPILSDELSDAIEKEEPQEEIDKKERSLNECRNKKAMYNMEYAAFIINVIIGFICVLLSLYNLQKETIPRAGIMGLGLGVIGFVLTLVYVIYNGIVYTNYYDKHIYKRDDDYAVAELVEAETNKYKCLYFNKENDTEALYAKYSDLIKSQYNYNRDLVDSFTDKHHDKFYCTVNKDLYRSNCAQYEIWEVNNTYFDDDWENEYPCKKLYYPYFLNDFKGYTNYDKSARFLTVLILSVFIVLCHIGLIFSGFKLFKGATSI